MKRIVLEAFLIVALVILGIGGRLLPHPPNFTPVAASALFAGFMLSDRRVAVCVPLATMAVSDLFIGFYKPEVMAVVYASLCFPVVLRGILARRLTPLRLAGCSLAASLLFYATTNGAVWAFGSLYSRDWGGLLACYVAGLPFLKLTLAGDMFWSAGLFGAYAACRSTVFHRAFIDAMRVLPLPAAR